MSPVTLSPTSAAEPKDERPARRTSALRSFLIFLAAFGVFEWLVNLLAPPFQGADKVERKFAYFAAHKDDFDFVFIGSSRVMNQISPKVFDETMAAAGHPCRSINLGYSAMFLPESAFLVERVRALHPARLRGMLIELSNPAPRHDEEHALMAREIYWHHPVEAALACAAVLTDQTPGFSTAERREQLWRQATILARCTLHLGDGPDLLDHLRTARRRHTDDQRPPRDVLGPDLDGYSPLLTTLGQGKTGVFKTGGSAVDLADFQTSVAALSAEHAASATPVAISAGTRLGEQILRRALRRQVAALRGSGISPVYFVGPGTTDERRFLDLARQGTVPTLLAFNDPLAYPALYQTDLRADRYHLNARGAVLLSRLLANRLAATGQANFSRSPK